jgi:hypothetical protein
MEGPMDKKVISEKLDWSRMLGFEQVGTIGSKVGNKPLGSITGRIGKKVGNKPSGLLRLGAKVGNKPVNIGFSKIGAKVGNKPTAL